MSCCGKGRAALREQLSGSGSASVSVADRTSVNVMPRNYMDQALPQLNNMVVPWSPDQPYERQRGNLLAAEARVR